jgi:uncharacterized LabA/DUF88 family protein
VDLGLDLVAHARNAAVDVIFLVSGDDDRTEAVEEAQAHGVQVTILVIPNAQGHPHGLQAAADGLDLLAAEPLDAAVAPRAGTVPNPASAEAQTQQAVP